MHFCVYGIKNKENMTLVYCAFYFNPQEIETNARTASEKLNLLKQMVTASTHIQPQAR